MNGHRITSAFLKLCGGVSFLLGVSCVAWGVSPAAGGNVAAAQPAPPALGLTTAPAAAAEPAYQSYKYMGDRYRDPFIPLTGNTYQATDRAPQVGSLVLKGIVEDSKGRVAIVSNGSSSYILRAGRLYDGRNHVVKGISGVVKAESVVLVGSDHTVKELIVDKSAL
jgi:hypothetical protein